MKTIEGKKHFNERAVIIALSFFFLFVSLSFTSNTSLAQKKKKTKNNFSTCLPKEIKPDEIVSFSLDAKTKNTTVKDELTRLKAKCVNKKLVDKNGKEIRFFKPSCWGIPPADYQEILERERKELEELKKNYTVIVFKCNPMIP